MLMPQFQRFGLSMPAFGPPQSQALAGLSNPGGSGAAIVTAAGAPVKGIFGLTYPQAGLAAAALAGGAYLLRKHF